MTNEQVYKILNDAPQGAQYFHNGCYYKIENKVIHLWIRCEDIWYSLDNKAGFICKRLTEENSLKHMEYQLRKSYNEACEQAYKDMQAVR